MQLSGALRRGQNTSYMARICAYIPLIIMAIMLFSYPASAQKSFALTTDTRIDYKQGHIDSDAGYIQLYSAQLFFEDELIFTADEIRATVENNPDDGILPDGGILIVRDLTIKQLASTQDEVDVFISEVTGKNLVLRSNFPLTSASDPEDIISYLNQQDDSHFKMSKIDFQVEEEGFAFSVDEIVIQSNVINPQDSSAAASKGSINITNAAYTPFGNSNDANQLRFMLAQIGTQSLDFNINGTYQSAYQNRRIATTLRSEIELSKLFDLSVLAELSFGHSLFDLSAYLASQMANDKPFDDDSFDDEELKRLAIPVVGDTLLHRLTLTLDDKGVLALDQSQEALSHFADKSEEDLPAPIDELFKQPMADFINEGGSLTLDMQPPTAANLLQLSTIALSPELAVPLLGLSVSHQ